MSPPQSRYIYPNVFSVEPIQRTFYSLKHNCQKWASGEGALGHPPDVDVLGFQILFAILALRKYCPLLGKFLQMPMLQTGPTV
jgi:hypothetical protein